MHIVKGNVALLHTMLAYGESRCILHLYITSELHIPAFHFYPGGNNYQYPLNKRLVGPQRWCGYFGKEKDLAPDRNKVSDIPAHRLTTTPTHYKVEINLKGVSL